MRLLWRGPAGSLTPLHALLGGAMPISVPHHAPDPPPPPPPDPTAPYVIGSQVTALESAASHALALPTAQAGDLLLAMYNGAAAASYTLGVPTGFTGLYDVTNGNLRGRAAARIATGGEGATASVTMGGDAQRFAGVVLAIRGWDEAAGIAGAITVGTHATGSSTAPNPPSASPAWGASPPTLVVALAHSAAGGSITYPSGYENGASAYTGVFNNFHARASAATREIAAASEDPAAFAIGNSVAWIARAIAIKGLA